MWATSGPDASKSFLTGRLPVLRNRDSFQFRMGWRPMMRTKYTLAETFKDNDYQKQESLQVAQWAAIIPIIHSLRGLDEFTAFLAGLFGSKYFR